MTSFSYISFGVKHPVPLSLTYIVNYEMEISLKMVIRKKLTDIVTFFHIKVSVRIVLSHLIVIDVDLPSLKLISDLTSSLISDT